MGYPIPGYLEEIEGLRERYGIDEIIINSEAFSPDKLMEKISSLERSRARIILAPTAYEMLIEKVGHKVHDIPLIELRRRSDSGLNMFWKWVMDEFLAVIFFILSLPIMAIITFAIKLTSRGPVWYCQERVGKEGKVFTLYKFRTMGEDAERDTGAVLAVEDDPRITFVGRILRVTRLDELPQLYNILRGDMSFVGPRPERPIFVEKFMREVVGYNDTSGDGKGGVDEERELR